MGAGRGPGLEEAGTASSVCILTAARDNAFQNDTSTITRLVLGDMIKHLMPNYIWLEGVKNPDREAR